MIYGFILALRNKNYHQLRLTFSQRKLTFGIFLQKSLKIWQKSTYRADLNRNLSAL
jgi:hypothetical protein